MVIAESPGASAVAWRVSGAAAKLQNCVATPQRLSASNGVLGGVAVVESR